MPAPMIIAGMLIGRRDHAKHASHGDERRRTFACETEAAEHARRHRAGRQHRRGRGSGHHPREHHDQHHDRQEHRWRGAEASLHRGRHGVEGASVGQRPHEHHRGRDDQERVEVRRGALDEMAQRPRLAVDRGTCPCGRGQRDADRPARAQRSALRTPPASGRRLSGSAAAPARRAIASGFMWSSTPTVRTRPSRPRRRRPVSPPRRPAPCALRPAC